MSTSHKFKTRKFKISHSFMETMESCKRKWFHRYVQKLYPKVEDDGSGTFGSFTHEVAEDFRGTSLKDLMLLAKEKLKDYEINDTYKPKVKNTLLNFFKYYKENLEHLDSKKIKREQDFSFPSHIEGYDFKGLIDILIVRNNKIVIGDYKTNKKEKDNTKQLAFYFLLLKFVGAVKEDEIDGEIIYLSLEDEDDVVIEKYHLTEEDLDQALDRVETIVKIIETKGTDDINKWQKKVGPLCDYCDYKKAGICDAKEEKVDNQLKEFIIKKKARKKKEGQYYGVR